MTLGMRKLVVLELASGILLLANALVVADWFYELGVIEAAREIREEFLTGTAIAVIVALLILLVSPGDRRLGLARRCGVCDRRVTVVARYCPECGSRL
jgi:hypothetical protein